MSVTFTPDQKKNCVNFPSNLKRKNVQNWRSCFSPPATDPGAHYYCFHASSVLFAWHLHPNPPHPPPPPLLPVFMHATGTWREELEPPSCHSSRLHFDPNVMKEFWVLFFICSVVTPAGQWLQLVTLLCIFYSVILSKKKNPNTLELKYS